MSSRPKEGVGISPTTIKRRPRVISSNAIQIHLTEQGDQVREIGISKNAHAKLKEFLAKRAKVRWLRHTCTQIEI